MTSSHQNKDAQSSKSGRKAAHLGASQSSKSGHPYLPLPTASAVRAAGLSAASPQLRWDRANPEAKRAHRAVAQALRRGRLTRAACEVCGVVHGVNGAVLHAHHESYSKPLDVLWLCRSDHRRLHAILRSGHWVKLDQG